MNNSIGSNFNFKIIASFQLIYKIAVHLLLLSFYFFFFKTLQSLMEQSRDWLSIQTPSRENTLQCIRQKRGQQEIQGCFWFDFKQIWIKLFAVPPQNWFMWRGKLIQPDQFPREHEISFVLFFHPRAYFGWSYKQWICWSLGSSYRR